MACALKIFEVGLESVVLYSMAGDTVCRKKSKALEGPVEKNFALNFVVVVPIIIAIVIVLHTDDGRNPTPPEI